MACFNAAIIDGNFLLLNTARTTFNLDCRPSRSGRAVVRPLPDEGGSSTSPVAAIYSSQMAAGLMLAVPEMVPAPPFRILVRRNDSLPTKTSKLPSASTSPLRRTSSALSPFGCWILERPWDLELGVWDFEIVS